MGKVLHVEKGRLLSVRVTPELMRRAERLLPRIARDQSVATIARVTRSTVIKLALLRGLALLENEYKQ